MRKRKGKNRIESEMIEGEKLRFVSASDTKSMYKKKKNKKQKTKKTTNKLVKTKHL